MDSTIPGQDWIRRAHSAVTLETEAALLDDLLNAGIEQTVALKEFAANCECRSIFRCAALDQYVKYGQTDDRERIDAEMFLDYLTNKETNDEVRLVAYQWLFEIAAKYGSTSRRGPEGETEWEVRLRNDPSPRVRWLTTMRKGRSGGKEYGATPL